MKLLNAIVGFLLLSSFLYLVTASPAPPEDDWFKAVVVDESRPVLVKFGAEWCPPCQHMEQVLDDLPSAVTSQVKVVRINIDEMPELASYYGVSTIPKVFLFKQGRVVAKHGGFQGVKDLQKWVDRQL